VTDALRPAPRDDAPLIARFLDDLRAAEAVGAEVVGAWLAVCTQDGLRGGLRVIGEREAGHAELLAGRLRELSLPCTAEVAAPVRAAALARFGSGTVSDTEKLALLLARYPDDASASRPIHAVMEDFGVDPETYELLRLVADGEAASIAWLRAYGTNLPRAARVTTPGR
jgi:hypothetical protein